MSYYTRFDLEIRNAAGQMMRCKHEKPEGAKFCPECGQDTGKFPVEMLIEEWLQREADNDNQDAEHLLEVMNNEDDPWSHWEDPATELIGKMSKVFPDVLFILSGEGERNEDMWKRYIQDGKVQEIEAEITFADFDPKKMIPIK